MTNRRRARVVAVVTIVILAALAWRRRGDAPEATLGSADFGRFEFRLVDAAGNPLVGRECALEVATAERKATTLETTDADGDRVVRRPLRAHFAVFDEAGAVVLEPTLTGADAQGLPELDRGRGYKLIGPGVAHRCRRGLFRSARPLLTTFGSGDAYPNEETLPSGSMTARGFHVISQ